MINPTFESILQKMKETHEKKNHDYASDDNPYSNFEFAAMIAKEFNNPIDKVFATMIGIKLARLAQLRNGKIAKNESVADTFLDNATYSTIWYSWFLDGNVPESWDAPKKDNSSQKIEQPKWNTPGAEEIVDVRCRNCGRTLTWHNEFNCLVEAVPTKKLKWEPEVIRSSNERP